MSREQKFHNISNINHESPLLVPYKRAQTWSVTLRISFLVTRAYNLLARVFGVRQGIPRKGETKESTVRESNLKTSSQ